MVEDMNSGIVAECFEIETILFFSCTAMKTGYAFRNMITNNAADSYAMVWVADNEASSVADIVRVDADGGMELGGGVSANLSEFLPLAVTVSGGVDVALPTNDDTFIAWNFGLSVAPMDALSIYFNGGGDGFIGNGFIFSTGVNYLYSIANVYFKLYNSWDADNEESYLGWGLGTTVSF